MKGGDGIVCEFEFLKDVIVSVLFEWCIFVLKGLAGGNDGVRGVNSLRCVNGEVVDLGGKNFV